MHKEYQLIFIGMVSFLFLLLLSSVFLFGPLTQGKYHTSSYSLFYISKYSLPQNRLALMATILLTSISFRSTITSKLPVSFNKSHLSYLLLRLLSSVNILFNID
jgi:hypothetical protein